MGVTKEDMLDFIAGHSSQEKEAEIRVLFKDENSFARKFIRYWHQKAENALNIDWRQLVEEPDGRREGPDEEAQETQGRES
jgi:hypothetical protein